MCNGFGDPGVMSQTIDRLNEEIRRTKYQGYLSRSSESMLVTAAKKVINARRQAANFSPGDKAQPWLANRIEEGLNELEIALKGIK